MAWPGCSMRRQRIALQRGFGQECQQHITLAHLEENMTARLLADDREAKDGLVEGFRRLEVIDVDGSFDDGLDLQDSLRSFRPLPIQLA